MAGVGAMEAVDVVADVGIVAVIGIKANYTIIFNQIRVYIYIYIYIGPGGR